MNCYHFLNSYQLKKKLSYKNKVFPEKLPTFNRNLFLPSKTFIVFKKIIIIKIENFELILNLFNNNFKWDKAVKKKQTELNILKSKQVI